LLVALSLANLDFTNKVKFSDVRGQWVMGYGV